MSNKTPGIAVLTSALALLAGAASAQQVTLDVVAWKGNDAEPAGLPQLLEKFEAENPDIDVDLTYVARKDVDKLIPPRLQGGNPPDVTMVDSSLVKLWGGAGFLTDLGTDSAWVEAIDPTLRSILGSDDAMYIMPLENIGMGNFVNMGLLRDAGIEEVPLTIEATKVACAALKDSGVNPMIFAGGFPAMLWVGANGLDPEGTAPGDFGTGEATFVDSEAFDASLSSVRELVDAGCFDPELQAGLDPWSTALEEFKSGRSAMMPHGAWNIGSFSAIEGLDYVFAPMPSRFGENGMALDLVGPGWAIPRDAKNADAARRFVDFFTVEENLSVFLTEEGAFSPFTGGASGLPELAAPYEAARAAGAVTLWPFSTLEWPKALQSEWEDSLTGFLLNLDGANEDTLQRWDYAVEDSL
ncbi:ABC transporter substrate-binding protein [Halovulum sp. GXIMD14794]